MFSMVCGQAGARGRTTAKAALASSRSSSQLSEERGPARGWRRVEGGPGRSGAGAGPAGGRPARRAETGELGGRTSEQGKVLY